MNIKQSPSREEEGKDKKELYDYHLPCAWRQPRRVCDSSLVVLPGARGHVCEPRTIRALSPHGLGIKVASVSD